MTSEQEESLLKIVIRLAKTSKQLDKAVKALIIRVRALEKDS